MFFNGEILRCVVRVGGVKLLPGDGDFFDLVAFEANTKILLFSE